MRNTDIASWDTEKFYAQSGEFFEALIEEVDRAKNCIDLSFYIFQLGSVGKQLLKALSHAVDRGVRVRLIVDGIGTLNWQSELEENLQRAGIDLRVFHPVPWTLLKIMNLKSKVFSWRSLNHRTHKKWALFDQSTIFVGGINVSDSELEWVDFAIRVSGVRSSHLAKQFELDWQNSYSPAEKKGGGRAHRLRGWGSQVLRDYFDKRKDKTELHDTKRIWIATGYFVPPRQVLRALKVAAKNGVDVRILVSKKSDVVVLTWLSRLYFRRLVSEKVKVYIYSKNFVHGKCTLLDSEAVVGSSNLNHRSFFLDSELDIKVKEKATIEDIERKIHSLMRDSELMGVSNMKLETWKIIVAKFLVLFKGRL